MTILAQRWLNEHVPSAFDSHVSDCLQLSTNISKVASRIVFDEDLYSVLQEMVKNEQLDFAMVCRNCRMPAERIWIEWHKAETSEGRKIDFGVLLTPNAEPSHPLMVTVVNQAHYKDDLPQVSCAFMTVPPPYIKGEYQKSQLIWTVSDDRENYREETWKGVSVLVMRVVVFALFLLQQPKIIEQTAVTHAPKLQAKRRKAGKQDLIEYQKVKMRFNVLGSRMGNVVQQGKSGPGGNIPDMSNEVTRRRYHFVLGHFRVIHRGLDNEIILWIEPHYRGDPTKGVLIRERTMSIAKGTT